jgi:glycosyltransferase involved in cell wall biosynthesis
MNRKPLTIGITTFNRRPLLEDVAQSLRQVDLLEQAHLLVMDDCSREYDAGFLQALFPHAEVIRAERPSGGADYAIYRSFEHFVRHGSGYFLSLDSDLLASRNLVDRCLRIIRDDDAAGQPSLYSLFNAPSHPAVGVEGDFLIKAHVGSAGTLWRHDLLADVLAQVSVSRSFDWDWSAYLTRRGVSIRVTPISYLQHIGRVGQNSNSFVSMDHGVGFDDYQGHNLAVFLDETRAGLLQMIAEQKTRLDKQGEAIVQLSQVIRNQARLINEIIGDLCPSETQ